MDKAKLKRTTLRSSFTKTQNKLVGMISDGAPKTEMKALFLTLEQRFAELTEASDVVVELLLNADGTTEEDLQKEYDDIDEYRNKFCSVKLSLEEKMAPPQSATAINFQSSSQGQNISATARTDMQNEGLSSFKLPKLQPTMFSGELKEWLKFWSYFKGVHEMERLSKEDKFQYLIKAMVPGSRADMLVSSYPPTADNYDKVISSLQRRFGREDLQIELYVRELIQVVLQNALNPQNIQLGVLYDKVETQLRALESFGVTNDKCVAILLPLVESALPDELLLAWQRKAPENSGSDDAKDRLTQLISFLEIEVNGESKRSLARQRFDLATTSVQSTSNQNKASDKKPPPKQIPSAVDLLAMEKSQPTEKVYECIFCSGNHYSGDCESAKKLDYSEKEAAAKKKNACYKCLKRGHGSRFCRSKVKCALCAYRHVTIMCKNQQKGAAECQQKLSQNNVQTLTNLGSQQEVFMKTIRVKLVNGEKQIIIRAFLDSGSQHSYITKKAAAYMGYEPIANVSLSHSLFGGKKTEIINHNKYLVYVSSLDDTYKCRFVVQDQEVICDSVKPLRKGVWCDELEKLRIKVNDFDSQNSEVSILIGADIVGKLYTGQIENLKCGLDVMETRFGWVLFGKVPYNECRADATTVAISLFVQEDNKISDLWSLDVLGIKDPIEFQTQKERDEKITKRFLSTVTVNAEKRYEVNLPWLEVHPILQDNRRIAEGRLSSTLRKLKSLDLHGEYDAVFNDWLAEGIIERVSGEEERSWGYYMPHRPVIKEGSTTKIRPVFDASAKDAGNVSLNDCLEKGPNLLEQVSSILLRFRLEAIGVVSDIRKAFLQISLNEKNKDYVRFLWLDKNGKIVTFRHRRVVFGVSSSPFILNAVISFHLQNYVNNVSNNCSELKNNVIKLANSLYVDNCVTSVSSESDLKSFISDSKDVMSKAAFDLRGWEYTNDQIGNEKISVLGIAWNKKVDTLSVNLPKPETFDLTKQLTKRIILAAANSIFDPLGLLIACTLCPRLLLQETWSSNLSWDEPIENNVKNVKKRFVKWVSSLHKIAEITIPRCFIGSKENCDISIHAFCDASQLAYASVIFIRVKKGDNVEVNFVQAKNRVAPKKYEKLDGRKSIPRLELLASTINARLTKTVLEALNLNVVPIYYWTDSTTVLTWVKRECYWDAFVGNRVKEIRSLTDSTQWRYVPSALNPADLPSRGCSVEQLIESKWLEGPTWLRESPDDWPARDKYSVDEAAVSAELSKSLKNNSLACTNICVTLSCTSDDKKAENLISCLKERFSNYSKLVRVFAWIKRFCTNVKNRDARRKSPLTIDEINRAEEHLIIASQTEHFAGVEDPRIKSLVPFKDDAGTIRIKTKILLRDDDFNFKCPIVLPKDCTLTRLIISFEHEKLHHAGAQITLNALRERFWVLGGRRTIRGIIKACVRCKRYSEKNLEPIAEVPLPLNRVRDAAVFEIVGVDFTGPIYLKGNVKAYVCLFTCAIYRAVSLELVTALSTPAFVMALRRLIARRGRCSIVYSDNGTNFAGISNLLNKINYEQLRKALTIEKIEWRFNPPSSPWWGGFFERLNGVLKNLLRRTLGRTSLDYEEMLTILLDCEAIINSRPITFMSDTKQELIPLSPSMFLQDIREIGVCDLDEMDESGFRKRFAYRNSIREDLRKRFRNEYLGALVHRKKNARICKEVCVGDVVLIENDANKKRISWPLARVKEVYRGVDGNIRVVKLITATGELTRPIQRLYPLELKSYVCDQPLEESIVKDFSENLHEEVVDPPLAENNEPEESNDPRPGEIDELIIPERVTRKGRQIKAPKRFDSFVM